MRTSSDYTFNEMNSNGIAQCRGRDTKESLICKSRSLDHITPTELTPQQLKILLSHNHNNQFSHAVAKQQMLAEKRLFDPNKYFGSPLFNTFQDSYNYHYPLLQAIFSMGTIQTERKTPKRVTAKGSLTNRVEQVSPIVRVKYELGEQSKRRMGKSPKSYLKQNKQNFMRLNLNNMQKMRVKLKLNKK